MRKRRNFDRNFKLSILSELQTKSAAEVCREHSLHPSVISKWKCEYSENPKKSFSGNGNLYKYEAEIAKRDRIIGQLYMEIDLLKKTTKRLQELNGEEERMRCIK
jgi:transposase-like protein